MASRIDPPICVLPRALSQGSALEIPIMRRAVSERRFVIASIAFCSLLVLSTTIDSRAGDTQQDQSGVVSLKQLSLEQLGNVQVTTASKEPEEVWRTPAAIYVITAEDIRRSGATNIPEALRLAPGVEVAQIDSGSWSVGIRGFGSGFSKSVLVLIDGRNVYTPLFAGVNWRLQNVLLEDVERIEIIRGPGGLIWGTNAVNGVINIITRNSKDSHGALVSVGGGYVDQGTGGFRYGGNVSKNLSYRIYGMAVAQGPEHHLDGGNFDDWQLGQGGFRMDWDNQKSDTLTLQGDLYKGEFGELENIAFYSPPASTNVNQPEDVSGGNLLGRWQHIWNKKSDTQVQAYYDRTYRLGSQLGEIRNTYDFDFIHHLTLLPRQDIVWGLGARWSPSVFIQTQPTVDFLPHHQSDNIYSAFLQDQFTLVENKLWATVGSKFEHNIYTGWEIQPSARLLWQFRSRQTVWAAVTRAVRSPSRLDEDLQLTGYSPMTSTTPAFILRIAGDPTFVSEQLLGYEIGYRALVNHKFYFDLSAFHNDYNDLTSFGNASFSLAPIPTPTLLITVPWANGIKGTTDGLEFAPDWEIANWWHLKSSYSYLYLKAEDKPGDADTSTAATYNGSSPHHEIVVQSLFGLPHRFELDPMYRYVSALPAQKVAAYNTIDVRIGWRAAEQIEFSVVGQNLLQPFHYEFSGDPGPLVGISRSGFAEITWRK